MPHQRTNYLFNLTNLIFRKILRTIIMLSNRIYHKSFFFYNTYKIVIVSQTHYCRRMSYAFLFLWKWERRWSETDFFAFETCTQFYSI